MKYKFNILIFIKTALDMMALKLHSNIFFIWNNQLIP